MSKKLPSVTSDIPRDLRTFIDRVRELISGSSNQRLISAQDLIDSGAVTVINNTIVNTTKPGLKVNTPPAPANLTATGGVNDVFLEWDNPTYFGHQYTEVYSFATDVIGDAVLVGFTPGVVYVDTIGPQQSRYYWVRFVNTNGEKGPFNATAGTVGTTTVEVAHMLNVLTGAIRQTELYTDLSARIDLIDGSGAGSVNARIATETTNRTTADTAIAGTVTTLSATVGANTSAIQTEVSTRASETGNLFSKYTVKIDQNGYVSGFGLASTANNATPFSDFIIRADRFSISSPTGPGITPVTPFIVVTTPTVIDGTNVPTGVYIDGGYIKGGSISGSAIIGGTITNSKLINVSADKITGAALEATSYIESAAYIQGAQGWKIHANGFAEFGAAAIRGQLTASQINSNGLTIKDTNGNIILNAGTSEFVGNVTGSIDGTSASTVKSNASTALSTANTAQSTATTANTTANTANSTANTANATANTANSTANTANGKADTAIAGLANKLNSNSQNVLAGSGGLATGTLTWNSLGVRTGGYGVGFSQNGIVAYNSAGDPTFVLNGATGAATFSGALSAATGSFAGSMSVGSSPALTTGPNMTGSGANIYSNGNFVLGNETTNLSFNGTTLKLNGNIVNTNSIPLGAVTTTVSTTGASNVTFSSGVAVSLKTSNITLPQGAVINCFFTAVKIAAGAGDINLLLNLLLSDGTLVATFLGQSGLEAVQTMGPSGDKVTATFTGTYEIPFADTFKVEAYISNAYGGSWTSKHCDLIVLATKR